MCDACDYEEFTHELDELIESGEADWALVTLEGIRETVADMEHVTDAQRRAVKNIADATHRHD